MQFFFKNYFFYRKTEFLFIFYFILFLFFIGRLKEPPACRLDGAYQHISHFKGHMQRIWLFQIHALNEASLWIIVTDFYFFILFDCFIRQI